MCMYKSVYINTYSCLLLSLSLCRCAYRCILFCPAILRNKAALLLSQYAIMNLHYFVSLAAFHSGKTVAEEQWFWKEWLGKKECSGGKDYVLRDRSLQFDSLFFHKTVNLRQLFLSCTESVIWQTNNSCAKILCSPVARKL